ncbi:hypothetical protein [Tropicimonas sp. IMCC6043]|uniref:hypothetical protein n=1 Tax=Tropicimonas sp. IMCC6043 TaxID=2510645 RepID=UPI00101D4216|nr:hypothetical protein [Tropicimonas sp. IMCC6043]RYH08107.1 hypothetical protein EU800_17590 [Tropicimonas sp. IMCC6043]
MRSFLAMNAIVLGLALAPAALRAEDTAQQLRIGNDLFAAGGDVAIEAEGLDDIFAVGGEVVLAAPVAGTSHMAGRELSVTAPLGGDLYAAGMYVTLEADVAGDVTAAGYRLSFPGAIGGDLRASGARVTLRGPVAGYALLAGRTLRLEGPVEGDVSLAGRTIEFGEAARVGGTLRLYADDPEAIEVPERVAPTSRIERHEADAFEGVDSVPVPRPVSPAARVRGFFTGVAFLAVLAALLAAIAPDWLADLRRTALARPGRSLWIGFLGEASLFGAVVVLGLTLIGLLAAPVLILLAVLFGFLGYIVGIYVLGVGTTGLLNRPHPETFGERAVAALVGAFAAALIALVPMLGWILLLCIALVGCGAILERAFRPRLLGRAD